MNDMRHDEDRLRAVLHAAVPEGPGAQGRSQALHDRRRQQRQRRVAGVGAAAAVVAAAAGASWLVGGSGGGVQPSAGPGATARYTSDHGTPDTRDARRRGTATRQSQDRRLTVDGGRRTQTWAAAPAPECGRPVQVAGSKGGGVSLPADVRWLLVCPAYVPGDTARTDLPERAVTGRASDLVARLRDLPTADPHRCDAVRPVPDPYVVTWADAAGRRGTGVVMSSCADVRIGGRDVTSDDFLRAYTQVVRGSGPSR